MNVINRNFTFGVFDKFEESNEFIIHEHSRKKSFEGQTIKGKIGRQRMRGEYYYVDAEKDVNIAREEGDEESEKINNIEEREDRDYDADDNDDDGDEDAEGTIFSKPFDEVKEESESNINKHKEVNPIFEYESHDEEYYEELEDLMD